jgi:hypothetical protein
MFSQDCHEVWVLVAVFTDQYVEFMANTPTRNAPAPPPKSEDEFLIIYEHGPYHMRSTSNVDYLLTLALALIIKYGNIEFPARQRQPS